MICDHHNEDQRTAAIPNPHHLPLSTAQFGQTLLPHLPKPDLYFETLGDVFTLWYLELGKIARQEFRKDEAKVADNDMR
jgi:hypothetical protein